MTLGPDAGSSADIDGLGKLGLTGGEDPLSQRPKRFRATPSPFSAVLLVVATVLTAVIAAALLLPGSKTYPVQVLIMPLAAFTGAFVGAMVAILVVAATWVITLIAYSHDTRSARVQFGLLGSLVGVTTVLGFTVTAPIILTIFAPAAVIGALQARALLRQSPRLEVTHRVGKPQGDRVLIPIVLAGALGALGLEAVAALFLVPMAFGGRTLLELAPKITDADSADLWTRALTILGTTALVVAYLLRPARFKLPTAGKLLTRLSGLAFAFGWPTVQFALLSVRLESVVLFASPPRSGIGTDPEPWLTLAGWPILILGLAAHLIALRRMRHGG